MLKMYQQSKVVQEVCSDIFDKILALLQSEANNIQEKHNIMLNSLDFLMLTAALCSNAINNVIYTLQENGKKVGVDELTRLINEVQLNIEEGTKRIYELKRSTKH